MPRKGDNATMNDETTIEVRGRSVYKGVRYPILSDSRYKGPYVAITGPRDAFEVRVVGGLDFVRLLDPSQVRITEGEYV